MAALIPMAIGAVSSAGVAGTVGTIGSVLSLGLTAASAFGSMQAGKQEAAAFNLQSDQATLNARMERLSGKQQAKDIQGQLDRDLASQNALFAARGVLAGEGSAAAARDVAKATASESISRAQFGAEIGALNAEQRASLSRSKASSAKSAGVTRALGTIASYKPVSSAPSGKVSRGGNRRRPVGNVSMLRGL